MGVVFSTIQAARVIDAGARRYARALMEWLRWPLASLASAARADEPGSGECHQRVHAHLPTRYACALMTRYARALMEWLR
jgi:hypothetical protein